MNILLQNMVMSENQGRCIQIRKLELGDMKSVLEILQQLSEFDPKEDVNSLFKRFDGSKAYAIVAFTELNHVVGFGTVYFMRKIRGGLQAQVEDVAVHKNYHNQGVGTLIVKTLINEANNKIEYLIFPVI